MLTHPAGYLRLHQAVNNLFHNLFAQPLRQAFATYYISSEFKVIEAF